MRCDCQKERECVCLCVCCIIITRLLLFLRCVACTRPIGWVYLSVVRTWSYEIRQRCKRAHSFNACTDAPARVHTSSVH